MIIHQKPKITAEEKRRATKARNDTIERMAESYKTYEDYRKQSHERSKQSCDSLTFSY